MHFTTNETVSVLAPASDPDADLPTEVFSAVQLCPRVQGPLVRSWGPSIVPRESSGPAVLWSSVGGPPYGSYGHAVLLWLGVGRWFGPHIWCRGHSTGRFGCCCVQCGGHSLGSLLPLLYDVVVTRRSLGGHSICPLCSAQPMVVVPSVQCKEKMRPVKKSLRQLGNPDQGVSDRDQLDHTRHCLLRIGTHIDNSLLDQHRTDVDAARLWRRWVAAPTPPSHLPPASRPLPHPHTHIDNSLLTQHRTDADAENHEAVIHMFSIIVWWLIEIIFN